MIKFCLLLLVLTCTACHKKGSQGAIPPLRVEVATARVETLYDRISFWATIEPLYWATIEPRVSGYLKTISYSDGERIESGAPLFTIESSSYWAALLAAEAQQQQAAADLALAKSNYDRAEPLSHIEAISQMEMDSYRSSYHAAQAQLDYASQQVATNRLNLDYTTINAPIAGVVARTAAKEGDFVGVGTNFATLTTIDYLDSVTLTLPIPTSRYFGYKRSQSSRNPKLLSEIKITLANGDQYSQIADYYYTKQSTDNSTVSVVAVVANPDHELKSGMFARVNAHIGEATPRVVIPQRAVSQMQGISSVWIVSADSTVSLRPVTLGSTYGDMWSVDSGVEAGEMVLLTGQLKVHNGAKIMIND